MRKQITILAITGAALLATAACSSSSSQSGSTDAAAATAECTAEVLQPAVNSAADALGRGNTMPISDLQCSEGWAVATGTLLPKNTPATFIFQASGDTWEWQEPATACGKSADSSEIPADLWPLACQDQ